MIPLIRSFRDDFRQLTKHGPSRSALIDERRSRYFTYGEIADLVDRFGALASAQGIEIDRPILSLLPNSVEAVVAFLGAAYWGIGYAPLTPEATGPEIARWAGVVKPGLAVISSGAPATTRKAIDRLGVKVITIDLDADFGWLPPAASRPPRFDARPARLYLTTSGSTGEPQAIVFDMDRLWSSGKTFVAHHRFLDEHSRFFNILPVSYLGGLFNLAFIPLATGGSVVVSEPFTGKTFLTFWQTVERFDINVLWLVPTMVRGLLAIAERTRRHEVGSMPKVKAGFLGTAPIDLATKRKFENVFGIPLLENFALSETTFFSSETLDTLGQRSEGSVGEILPYVDVKFAPIASDDGSSGASPKEIQVKSPFLILGYLKADGSVTLPLDEDGFFPTKDLGHLEGARLIVDGRVRDIIKKGGLLISLRETELVAEGHPAVAEAIAVRQAHEFYGESYVLFLRLKETQPRLEASEIGRWLHGQLAKYKWPQSIEVVDDFPRTASGKVRKHALVPSPKVK